MNRRANLMLVIALWVVPLAIGIAIASQFLARGGVEHQVVEQAPEDRRGFDDRPLPLTDRERLQGTWECTLLERDGRVVYSGEQAKTARVTFQAETVTFEDGGTTLEGQFRLDPSQRPKTFDLTLTEGDDVVTYPVGIYELSDDTFRLCFAFPARVRPTRFETAPGSGRTQFLYRRVLFEEQGSRNLARSIADQSL